MKEHEVYEKKGVMITGEPTYTADQLQKVYEYGFKKGWYAYAEALKEEMRRSDESLNQRVEEYVNDKARESMP